MTGAQCTYNLGDAGDLLLKDGHGVTDGGLLVGVGDGGGAESSGGEASQLMLLQGRLSEVLREHIVFNYKYTDTKIY